MPSESASFTGWSSAALDFYEGLELDNSRDYWLAHKKIYDSEVRAPMEALLGELEPEFGAGKLFRPNRDIRFSADKSPYKTVMGATVGHDFYVQFSAHGLAVGSGYYEMSSDQVQRYREAVAENHKGEELRRIIAAVESQGLKVSASQSLKSAPRGYEKDHPREDLLRYKNITSWIAWPIAGWLHTAAARPRIEDAVRASRPLIDWLNQRVGPSDMPRR